MKRKFYNSKSEVHEVYVNYPAELLFGQICVQLVFITGD